MAGSTTDKLKGRLKEAAGALTGDEKLKKEGKLDQAAAEVKETVEGVVEKPRKFSGAGRTRTTDRATGRRTPEHHGIVTPSCVLRANARCSSFSWKAWLRSRRSRSEKA